MSADEWRGFIERIERVARIGVEEFGLTVSIHPHAGGYLEFLPEVERMLEDVAASTIGLCVDTGHCRYAGFDPIEFMRRQLRLFGLPARAAHAGHGRARRPG